MLPGFCPGSQLCKTNPAKIDNQVVIIYCLQHFSFFVYVDVEISFTGIHMVLKFYQK